MPSDIFDRVSTAGTLAGGGDLFDRVSVPLKEPEAIQGKGALGGIAPAPQPAPVIPAPLPKMEPGATAPQALPPVAKKEGNWNPAKLTDPDPFNRLQPSQLRRDIFSTLTQDNRMEPQDLRNIADPDKGGLGEASAAVKTAKGYWAKGFEEIAGLLNKGNSLVLRGLKLLPGDGRVANPDEGALVGMDQGTSLLTAQKGAKLEYDKLKNSGKFDETDRAASKLIALNQLVRKFNDAGITDGKVMMDTLRDSIKENNWDSSSNDDTRVLSNGEVRLNPKFVVDKDPNAGISAIQKSDASPEQKDQEIAAFKESRKEAARGFTDRLLKEDESGFKKHVADMAAKGITDPEQVFFSWDGLDQNFIEKTIDVTRDVFAQAGRDLANQARGIKAGLYESGATLEGLAGLDTSASEAKIAEIGRDILASKDKSDYAQELAAARGESGMVLDPLKSMSTSVAEMAPMILAGGAGAIAARSESVAARILGSNIAKLGVYGTAGAQGYGSVMENALSAARDKAQAENRNLTDAEINQAVQGAQAPALVNAAQTMFLSKLFPEGSEATALKGGVASAAEVTGADILRAAKGAGGLREAMVAVKPQLKEFFKQAWTAAKVGFTDEAIEEGLNQYIEGVVTKATIDPNKSWEDIGAETWSGTWQGGLIGGALPALGQAFSRRNPQIAEAEKLVTDAAPDAPASAQAAAATIADIEKDSIQPEISATQATTGKTSDISTDTGAPEAVTEPAPISPESEQVAADVSQNPENVSTSPNEPIQEVAPQEAPMQVSSLPNGAAAPEVTESAQSAPLSIAAAEAETPAAVAPEIESLQRRAVEARKELDARRAARNEVTTSWARDEDRFESEGEELFYPDVVLPREDAYLKEFLPLEAVGQGADGKWYFADKPTPFDTLEEAQDFGSEEIKNALKELAPKTTFGSDADAQAAIAPIFSEFPASPSITSEWSPSKWGSWYLSFKDSEGTTRKISIRDHGATRADMGLPDKSFFVDKSWSPEKVAKALTDAWEYIQENTTNEPPTQESVPQGVPATGNVQAPSESRMAEASQGAQAAVTTTPQINAPEERNQPEGRVSEYPNIGQGRATAEASSRNLPVQGWEGAAKPQEVAKPRQITGRLKRNVEIFREHPAISAMSEVGTILSKTAAKRVMGKEWFDQNKSLYDDAPTIAPGYASTVYSDASTITPDQMATALANRNIGDGTVNTLWKLIAEANDTANRVSKQTGEEETRQDVEARQLIEFQSVQQEGGEQTIDPGYLNKGDVVVIDGEKFTVDKVELDDNGEPEFVTLQDGPRFGRQVVEAGRVLFVEEVQSSNPNLEEDFLAGQDTEGTPVAETPAAQPKQPAPKDYSVEAIAEALNVPMDEAVALDAIVKATNLPTELLLLQRGGKPGALSQFAGENAQVPQFMRDSLETAKAMAAEGKDSETIRAVTGWFPGMDGKMRWEIPDEGASLTEEGRVAAAAPSRTLLPLEAVVDHPALFDAYPSARRIMVEIKPDYDSTNRGSFNYSSGLLSINTSAMTKKSEVMSTLLHEVQHWIQREEGFARGSNTRMFAGNSLQLMVNKKNLAESYRKAAMFVNSRGPLTTEIVQDMPPSEQTQAMAAYDSINDRWFTADELLAKEAATLKEIEDIDFDGTESYERTAGEIEARDVQARRTMTPEQRAATAPYSTQNIAPEDAIILYQNAKASFTVLANGKILLQGFKNSDFSSGAHEIAHVIRELLLNRDNLPPDISPEDLEVAELWAGDLDAEWANKFGGEERLPWAKQRKRDAGATRKWVGVKDGEWSIAAEEKFARGFERYLRDGVAPNQALIPLFKKIGEWMKRIYASLTGSALNVEISPAMKRVFDKLMTRNPDVVYESPPEPVIPEPLPVVIAPPVSAEESATGIKHAISDADRERYNMPPRFKPAADTFEEAWDRALATEDQWRRDGLPGTAGENLLQSLLNNPRMIDFNETALLTHEKLIRENGLELANKALNDAPEGLAFGARLDLRNKAEKALESYNDLMTFLDSVGSQTGKALAARKMMVKRDFSLPAMLNSALAAKNKYTDTPQKLSKEERDEIVELHAKLKAAQDQVAALEAEKDEALTLVAQLTKDVQRAQIRAEKEKPKIRKALQPQIDLAKARLEAMGIKTLFQEMPASAIKDLAVIGAGWMIDRSYDLRNFTTKLTSTFGTWVAEYAEGIFDRANQIYAETSRTVQGKAAPTPAEVLSRMEGGDEPTKREVYELARAHVIAGVRGAEVLDRTTGDLKTLFKDISREEVAKVFTDYGRTIYPNQEETPRQLRHIRAMELKALKLAAVRAKMAPERTGYQRVERTEGMTDSQIEELKRQEAERRAAEKEFRQAYRDLEDEMEAAGVPLESTQSRLKSALATAKTRMRNEISEIERALELNQQRSVGRRPVQYDEEALQLKSELEAKRSEYDAAFGEGMTPEKRAAALLKSLDRQIAEEDQMLKDGVLKRRRTEPVAETPEIAEKRRILAEKRQTRRDLYEATHPGETALQQAKNAAIKSIERLQSILESGVVAVKAKKQINPDEELQALWDVREALNDEVAELRRSQPMSPEKEQASIARALAAAQASLDKVNRKIESGDLSVPPMTSTPASRDAAVQEIRRQVKERNKELARMRRDAIPKQDPEVVREKRQLAAIQKRKKELTRRIGEKDFTPKAKPTPLNTPEIRKARYAEEKLKAQYVELQGEYALKNASFGRKAVHYLMSVGLLSKMVKLGGDLGVIYRQLSEASTQMIARDLSLLARMYSPVGSMSAKAKAEFKEQGLQFTRMLSTGLKSFFDPAYETAVHDAIISRPTAVYDKVGKMVYAAPFDSQILQKDDIPRADLLKSIPWYVWPALAGGKWALLGMAPPVGITMVALGALTKPGLIALDRAQRAMTNQARAVLFDAALASLPQTATPSARDVEIIGKMVMAGTGRGTLPTVNGVHLDSAIPVLNMFANATRFYISRLQVIAGAFNLLNPKAWMDNPAARKEVAKMYGRSLAGRAVLYTLLWMLLGRREDDEDKDGIVVNPLSSDFMKIRSGKVAVDFMGGTNSFVVALAKVATGRKVNSKGEVVNLREKSYGNVNDEVMRFLKSKRNLNFAFLWDTFVQPGYYGGKEVTPRTALEEATNMIIVNDTKRIFEELGPVKGAAVWALMFGGAGTSVQDDSPKKVRLDAYGNPIQ